MTIYNPTIILTTIKLKFHSLHVDLNGSVDSIELNCTEGSRTGFTTHNTFEFHDAVIFALNLS